MKFQPVTRMNGRKNIFVSLLFLFSVVTLIAVMAVMETPNKTFLYNIPLAFLAWFFILFKTDFANKVLSKIDNTDISISLLLTFVFCTQRTFRILSDLDVKLGEKTELISSYSFYKYVAFFVEHKAILLIPIVCFAAFSFFVLIACVINRVKPGIKNFFAGLGTTERRFIYIGTAVLSVIVCIVFSKTNAFYLPATDQMNIGYYNIIYTSDSGSLMDTDCYMNPFAPENDIRQPLFGILAIPFAIFARVLSWVFFFVPFSYPLFIAVIQVFLLLISIVLLGRMLELNGKDKLLYYLLFAASFPFMLFTLVMEQYVFALLALTLLMYWGYVHRSVSTPWAVLATGTLLTSSVMILPQIFMFRQGRDFFRIIWQILKTFFIAVLALGLTPILVTGVSKALLLINIYAGEGVTLADRLHQFTHFVWSCFVVPRSEVALNPDSFISYQLVSGTFLHYGGLVLLGLSIAGAITGFKNYLVKLSGYWVLFSFVLIGLIGWGTNENGTVLYSLYFSWAFLSLIFILISKSLNKMPILKLFVLGGLLMLLLVVNLKGMIDMVHFGITYYPVK